MGVNGRQVLEVHTAESQRPRLDHGCLAAHLEGVHVRHEIGPLFLPRVAIYHRMFRLRAWNPRREARLHFNLAP